MLDLGSFVALVSELPLLSLASGTDLYTIGDMADSVAQTEHGYDHVSCVGAF